MGLYRRNKVWWFAVMHDGKRIQDSLKTENKKLAERIFAKVLLDIQEGRWFDEHYKRKTLKEMFDRYKKEYTERKDYYQKARDKTIFKKLSAFLGDDCPLGKVENLIGGYEHHRRGHGVKPATIMKELGLLRRIFNVARKQWKWKLTNPVSEIELPKVNNRRVRYLNQDEYKRLLAALDAAPERWLKTFVTMAIETGLRLSNLCDLQWAEVNIFSRFITIDADKMKNNEYIGIPLTDTAHAVLLELQKVKCVTNHVFHDDGHPLYYVKIQRAFSNALTVAQIENFHFHDLRHTFASMHVQAGTELYTLQKLLGHKDSRMTQRYAHLSAAFLTEAIRNVNGSVTNLLHGEQKKKELSA